MDYKTYRKYSTSLLASEFRSYGRNKMEDRKLAMHHDGVDKHKERRRKSFVSEKDQINKHFQEKVSKTTPSLEKYLERSQPKYNAWKLREQERLDRRYRGLYKSYLKEYSDLKLDASFWAMTEVRKLSTASDTDIVPTAKTDKIDGADNPSSDDVTSAKESESANQDQPDGVENPDTKSAEYELDDKVLSLEQMSLDTQSQKKLSLPNNLNMPSAGAHSRRFSTGGIIFQEEKKGHVTSLPNTKEENEVSSNPPETTFGENVNLKKGDNPDEKDSLTVKKKSPRRMSTVKKPLSLQLPLGTRLDRRSSLANVNIAVKYGN